MELRKRVGPGPEVRCNGSGVLFHAVRGARKKWNHMVDGLSITSVEMVKALLSMGP
jgi:hypothetical protein